MNDEEFNFNELVILENDQPVTTSKNIANVFNKAHDKVMRDIRNLLDKDVAKIGGMFFEDETTDKYNRPQKQYLMNKDGFALLVMGYNGKKAIEFKLAYIDAFNKMEEKLKEQMIIPSYQIEDPIQRAKRWIEEEKERRRLVEDNHKLQEENQSQAQQIEESKPKLDYYNEVLNSNQLVIVNAIASDYGLSAMKLNQLLSALHVQYKQSNMWLLYKKYRNKGYAKTKTYKEGWMTTQWTHNGRLFIYEILKKQNIRPLVEDGDEKENQKRCQSIIDRNKK